MHDGRRAHEAAGGERFVRPGSLFLSGYNIIRRDGGEMLWDRYAMWRVFGNEKLDAHRANGMVRIEAWTDGEWAWPASENDDAQIIAAMKRGVNAVLSARSSRGTTTKDTFSLLGFTAAVEEAERAA
mgnify:CR=1 FL=1